MTTGRRITITLLAITTIALLVVAVVIAIRLQQAQSPDDSGATEVPGRTCCVSGNSFDCTGGCQVNLNSNNNADCNGSSGGVYFPNSTCCPPSHPIANSCVSGTPTCGDNLVQGSEVCDGGSRSCTTVQGYSGTQACNNTCTGYNTCTSTQFCGDNNVNGNEVCDGNSRACTTSDGQQGTQACNNACTAFDTCVPGAATSSSSTSSTSSINLCGNGVCDAGENVSCPSDCTTCGNGLCEAGETAKNCPNDCGLPDTSLISEEADPVLLGFVLISLGILMVRFRLIDRALLMSAFGLKSPKVSISMPKRDRAKKKYEEKLTKKLEKN